jgi:hypothetical protein
MRRCNYQRHPFADSDQFKTEIWPRLGTADLIQAADSDKSAAIESSAKVVNDLILIATIFYKEAMVCRLFWVFLLHDGILQVRGRHR